MEKDIQKLYDFRKEFIKMFPHHTGTSVELIDALSSNINAKSIIELTLNPAYTRNHSSIFYSICSFYKPRVAKEESSQDLKKKIKKLITNTLCKYISKNDTEFYTFVIDVTPYKRPASKKLEDKSFIYTNSSSVRNKPVSIGHKYSFVTYLTKDKSWTLPIDAKRVTTTDNETVLGVKQWMDISIDPLNEFTNKLVIGVFDAAYSNAYAIHEFTKRNNDNHIFIARLRSNRIIMRPYQDKGNKSKKGRRPIFNTSNSFELKSSDTWNVPDDQAKTIWIRRNKTYTVNMSIWKNMRMRGHKNCEIQQENLAIIRINVTDKDGINAYKNDLWLVTAGNYNLIIDLKMYWEFYGSRFDVEHFFRFGKQKLLLTNYQTCEVIHEENWLQFPIVAYHNLFHSRKSANFLPRPWEKKTFSEEVLPPSMVQRDMPRILKKLPKIIEEKKIRGVPKGRIIGDKIGTRINQEVVRKTPVKVRKITQIRIIIPSEKGCKNSKPLFKYDNILEKDIDYKVIRYIQKSISLLKNKSPPDIRRQLS